MDSISLTQVTAFVVAVSMASFLVNADDDLAYTNEDNTVVNAENSANADAIKKAIEEVKEPNDKFTFTSLDMDKNGMLSRQEVVDGKNEWLVESFTKIDSNTDESLTEQELVDFVAKKAATMTAATK
jgi:Ca2+-binding EF-hand superfamily protein|tara:strand:+ start:65 stop:445 length:381 start_codon:yes stop_codon:yes gene_type:complete